MTKRLLLPPLALFVALVLAVRVCHAQNIKEGSEHSTGQSVWNELWLEFDKNYASTHDTGKLLPQDFVDRILDAPAPTGDTWKPDYLRLLIYRDRAVDDSIVNIAERLLEDQQLLNDPKSTAIAFWRYRALGRKGFRQKQLETLEGVFALNEKHNNNLFEKSYTMDLELGLLYYQMRNFPRARDLFMRAAEGEPMQQDLLTKSSMMNNIALTYEKEHNVEEAIKWYDRSLEILEDGVKPTRLRSSEYNDWFYTVVRSNRSTLLMREGNSPVSLLEDLEQEIAASNERQQYHAAALAYANLADYYIRNAEPEIALTYLDSASVRKDPRIDVDHEIAVQELRRNALFLLNRPEDATQAQSTATRMRDSLNTSQALARFEDSASEMDFAIAEERLAANQKELILRKNQNRQQLALLLFATIALATVLILIARISKSKRIISERGQEVSKALKAKETMIDEIHHRIKNNLQIVHGILELKKGELDNEQALTSISDTQNHIQSMAFIHEHLYSNDSKQRLHMLDYTRRLAENIVYSHNRTDVEVNVTGHEVILDVNDATPLGLLTCELITNSLKHAFPSGPGAISIDIQNCGKSVCFEYQDSGKGFDQTKVSGNTLGLKLIHLLAEELDGELTLNTSLAFYLNLQFIPS